MSSSIVAAAKKKADDLCPVDKIISKLQHSPKPNIVVEGPGDYPIYQRLVGSLGLSDIDYHVAECRNNLLAIYKRRSEFPHKPVAFIADKDMWVFTGVPAKYKKDIIFTDGYSIENDLYVAGNLEDLLDPAQQSAYKEFIQEICKWKAFEVAEFRNKKKYLVDIHLNRIIPPKCNTLDPNFCKSRGFYCPPPHILSEVTNGYQRNLRGKLLFDILIRFLMVSSFSEKYNHRKLSHVALKDRPDSLLKALEEKVKEKIPQLKSSSLSGIAKIVSETYGAKREN